MSYPPWLLTTLQSTKLHGVQAKRSHLYRIMQKHTKPHCILCCITALIFGSLVSLLHKLLNMFTVLSSVVQVFQHFAKNRWASFFQFVQLVQSFQVPQHSAKNRWASFFQLVQFSQVFQHSAKNRWASFFQVFQHFEQHIGTQTILCRMLEKLEDFKNDAQRFFAECWKSWKMMPNDSLQTVGKLGQVGKHWKKAVRCTARAIL